MDFASASRGGFPAWLWLRLIPSSRTGSSRGKSSPHNRASRKLPAAKLALRVIELNPLSRVERQRGRRLVVGFASGVHYIHPDKPPELWINEVALAPTRRRRGLGTAVLKSLFEVG